MGVKRLRIQIAGSDRGCRRTDPIYVDACVTLMRIDHIQPSPIPKLHVDTAHPVLVVACDHEPAAFFRDVRSEVQSLLVPDRLNDPITSPAGGKVHHAFQNLFPGVELDHFSRAVMLSEFQREWSARDRYHPCTRPSGKGGEDRSQKTDTQDGHTLAGLNRAPLHHVKGAAERFSRERFAL